MLTIQVIAKLIWIGKHVEIQRKYYFLKRKFYRCKESNKVPNDNPNDLRNSPPEVFLEKGVLKICSKFTGEDPCQSVISIKLLCFADLRPATLLKKRLWHRYFPVNFAKFFRTPFSQNTSGGCFCEASR